MTDEFYNVKINYESDSQDAIKKTEKIRDLMQGLDRRVNLTNASSSRLAETLESGLGRNKLRDIAIAAEQGEVEISKFLNTLQREFAISADGIDLLERKIRSFSDTAATTNGRSSAATTGTSSAPTPIDRIEFSSAFREAEDYNDSLRRSVGLLGDVDSGLQTIRGTLDAFGLPPEFTKVIANSGEIFASGEAVVQLIGSTKGLGAAARETLSQLSATSKGLGAVGIAAGVAFVALNALAEKNERTFRNIISDQLDYIDLVATASDAELKAQEDLLRQQEDIQRQQLAVIQDALSQVEGAYSDAGFNAENLLAVQNRLNDLGIPLRNGIGSLIDAEKELEGQLEETTGDLNTVVSARNNELVVMRAEQTALEELTAKRRAAADALLREDIGRQQELLNGNFTLEDVIEEAENLETLNEYLQQQIIERVDLSAEEITAVQESILANRRRIEFLRGDAAAQAELNDLQKQGAEALERARALTEQNNAVLVDSITARIAKENELADFISSTTVEGLADRIESLELERKTVTESIAELEALAETNEAARTKLNELRSTLAGLDSELSTLNRTGTQASVGARAVGEAVNDINEIRSELSSTISSIRADLSSKLADIDSRADTSIANARRTYERAVENADRNYSDALASNNSRLTQAIADAEQQRDRTISTIEENYVRDRAQAIQDANDAALDAQEDYNKERQEIADSLSDSLSNAARRRDAGAVFEARERAAKELEDATETRDDRLEEIRQGYIQELEDLEENLALRRTQALEAFEEQRNDAIQAYNEANEDARQARDRARSDAQRAFNDSRSDALGAQAQARADAIAAANQRIIDARNAANQEIAERRNALNAQLSQLNSFSSSSVTALSNFNSAGTSIIGNFVSNSLNQLNSLMTSARQAAAANTVNVSNTSTTTINANRSTLSTSQRREVEQAAAEQVGQTISTVRSFLSGFGR